MRRRSSSPNGRLGTCTVCTSTSRCVSSIFLFLELIFVTDGCFVITALLTRTLLWRRNKKRLAEMEARRVAEGDEFIENLHAFEVGAAAFFR